MLQIFGLPLQTVDEPWHGGLRNLAVGLIEADEGSSMRNDKSNQAEPGQCYLP